jgi:hypothetical protein
MVALQDGLTMSAEMLMVVMLARQASRAHASGHDVERSAGTEEDCLNALAARPVRQVCEGRTHRCIPIRGRATRGVSPWVWFDRPKLGFLNREQFPAEKDALGSFIGDVREFRHTEVPPKFSWCSHRRPDRGPAAGGLRRPPMYARPRRSRGSGGIQTENPAGRRTRKAVVVVVFP